MAIICGSYQVYTELPGLFFTHFLYILFVWCSERFLFLTSDNWIKGPHEEASQNQSKSKYINKYILQYTQIYVMSQTNTFCNSDKYFSMLKQIIKFCITILREILKPKLGHLSSWANNSMLIIIINCYKHI